MSDPRQAFRACTTFQVEFADTDAQGVAYYPNYFRFFDRGRLAYWETIGLEEEEIRRIEQDTVVVEVWCRYHAPVRFYDRLTIYTRVTRIKRSSFALRSLLYHESSATMVAEGETVLVNTDRSTERATPLPARIRALIEAFEGEALRRG